MKINPKYKVNFVGEYNAMINKCPSCLHFHKLIFNNTIGIAENHNGQYVFIVECKKCFIKYWFHVRDEDNYETFLDYKKEYHTQNEE
jgi:RNase P subunit RPR2